MYYLENKVIGVVLLLFALIPAYAQQHIIDIKAQNLKIDEKKGISQYTGDVVLTRQSLIVKADSITLYHKDKKLIKALITGSPADLQHQPENEEPVHSQARQMEYLVDEERLILVGEAFVNQGNRHFSGERIEYDTQRRIIVASGQSPQTTDASTQPVKNARVHVIIGPDNQTKKIKLNN